MADRDLRGRKLGEFVLLDPLADGGFGTVWRGAQPSLKREVAVKVLHECRRSDDLGETRFLREAQLISQLDHPNIVHIYDFGVEKEDELLWIAMELVQGITLDEWLCERGPMPFHQFVPFFEGIAEAVHLAHERGIVHRDLKPSNVMVIERGGRVLPKLLDFGIAKVTHEVPESWPAGSLAGNHGPMNAPTPSHGQQQRTGTDPRLNVHRLTRPVSGLAPRRTCRLNSMRMPLPSVRPQISTRSVPSLTRRSLDACHSPRTTPTSIIYII